VLRDISLTVGEGETVAILGPSGSGKSTLLNLIGSLDLPSKGTIHVGATEVNRLEGDELARYRSHVVGFVFQEHHLLPQLTALENVLLPTLPRPFSEESESRAVALLEAVGVSHRKDALPATMSGGERQRVAVARAIINAPALLLCDEPTGNLDKESGHAVVDLLLELAAKESITVLMATHNLEHASRFSRCLRLEGGLIVEG
jgi:ABC-type lipoprotein export system ATPase subunit